MNTGLRPDWREETVRRTFRPLNRQAGIDASFSTPEPRVQLRRYIKFLTSGSRGWGDYYADHGDRFLRIGNLSRGNLEIGGDIQFVNLPSDVTEGSRTMLQEGDLLFSITAYLGSVAVVAGDWVGAYVSQHVALCRLEPDRVDPRFIGWFMLTTTGQDQLNEGAAGGTKMQLALDDIRGLRIPSAPIEEQRRIAAYLDRETARIDMLIEEQQRLIGMLRERRTAVIAHATSQGADVEVRRVIAVLRQGWSPNCESWPADGVAEWGVLKVGCANTGRFDPAENKRLPDDETPRPELAVRQGEIVMSRSNTKDLVGAAAVVDGNYPRLLLSDLTYGLSLTDDADPAFMAYALGSPSMRVQISAASKGMSHSMQKISQRDIRELRVRLPAIDEQRRVAAYLDGQTAKIDALIEETERFIQLVRERRSALISAAVTGQIDVGVTV